jgi:hypothetical protein
MELEFIMLEQDKSSSERQILHVFIHAESRPKKKTWMYGGTIDRGEGREEWMVGGEYDQNTLYYI